MPNSHTILIVAGEPSGDTHASHLIAHIKRLVPNSEFFGMGGALMKDAGAEIVAPIERLAVIGAVDVVKNIAAISNAFHTLLAETEKRRPALAVLVDYPGFNLRLAKALKNKGVPVIYYISPQIWAWGFDRIGIIKSCIKKMLVFFKFEEELYKKNGVDAEWIGHPLVEKVRSTMSRVDTLKKYGLTADAHTFTLVPGSRKTEIRLILPSMAETAKRLSEKYPNTQWIISKHPSLPREMYDTILSKTLSKYTLVEGDIYNILAASEFAIVTSGTATLETAIIGTPFVLVYKSNFINFLLFHMVKTTNYLGLVNNLAKKEVVPEFLQYHAMPKIISEKIRTLLEDPHALTIMRSEFDAIRRSLGTAGASARAAEAIAKLL